MNRAQNLKLIPYRNLITLTAVLMLVAMGCSRPQPDTPDPTPTTDAIEVPPSPGDTTNASCSHLLWPLTEESSWLYQLTGPSGSEELDLEVKVENSILTWQFGGQSVTLNCVDGAVSALMPALVAHPDLGRGLTGSNPRGSLLPSPDQLLPLGTPVSWDFELDASGTIAGDDGSLLSVASGKLVFYRTVSGVTAITVPAGTYSTLSVKEDAFLDLEVDGQPVIVSASSTHYYAEGVGLIRIDFGEGLVSGPEISRSLGPGWSLSLVSVTP